MELEEIGKDLSQALTDGIWRVAFTAIVCLIVAKYSLKLLRKMIDKSHLETTMARFLKAVLRVVIYFVAGLIIATSMGFDMTSLVAFASVVSASFALAAQGALSNLFGGILMLWTKPFLVGDYVITDVAEGTVLEINLFNTTLTTIDNKRVVIPNSTISATTITNCSTEGKRRIDLEINVSYDSPVESVKRALHEAVDLTEGTLAEPAAPFVRLYKYGDNAITYMLRVWAPNPIYWDVYFDLMENIKIAIDRNNVSMTYSHVIVHQEKPVNPDTTGSA